MSYKQTDKQIPTDISAGYEFIFEDTEEKYIYLTLKNGKQRETPRADLLEIIKSGKPLPILEIRKRNYSAEI